ncbi:MAG: hypothetical protein U0R19_17715 [Bryobacteraceae bacterium]
MKPPDPDPLHFNPRVRVQALFDRLGSPPGEKRRVTFDAGHVPLLNDIRNEVITSLDRHLRPVSIRSE